jgi:uncharacterized protein YheU (UPF0270 family)
MSPVPDEDERPPPFDVDAEPRPPVEIPYTELTAEALRGVIESFVLREGTEYGATDVSLERKVQEVLRQLERREAQITFDPETETINLVVKRSLQK